MGLKPLLLSEAEAEERTWELHRVWRNSPALGELPTTTQDELIVLAVVCDSIRSYIEQRRSAFMPPPLTSKTETDQNVSNPRQLECPLLMITECGERTEAMGYGNYWCRTCRKRINTMPDLKGVEVAPIATTDPNAIPFRLFVLHPPYREVEQSASTSIPSSKSDCGNRSPASRPASFSSSRSIPRAVDKGWNSGSRRRAGYVLRPETETGPARNDMAQLGNTGASRPTRVARTPPSRLH